MQYYDILGDADLPTDGVDTALDFMHLRWPRAGKDGSEKAYSEGYVLCPLDIVQGLVHMVRGGAMTRRLRSHTKSCRSIAAVCGHGKRCLTE